ncbi:hypothetical protein ACQ4PT_006638 [Festuca glaucescens]
MVLLDGIAKVLQMVELFEAKQVITVIVLKGRAKPPATMNTADEEQIPISHVGEEIVYDVDADGVLFPSQPTEEVSDCLYIGTQQSKNCYSDKHIVSVQDGGVFVTQKSINMEKGKTVCVEENYDSFAEDSNDENQFDKEEYISDDIDEETKQENLELSQKIIDMKRRRAHTAQHCEGDTEAEELYYEPDNDPDSDCHVVYEPEPEPEPEVVHVHMKKLKPVRPGPTQRSHMTEESSAAGGSYYVPSSDSGSEFDLAEGDDDGAEENRASEGSTSAAPASSATAPPSATHQAPRPASSASAPPQQAPRPTPPAPQQAPRPAPSAPHQAPRPAKRTAAAAPEQAPKPARRTTASANNAPGPRPFTAPRYTEPSTAAGLGKRTSKKTPKMQVYLNAGKHDSHK